MPCAFATSIGGSESVGISYLYALLCAATGEEALNKEPSKRATQKHRNYFSSALPALESNDLIQEVFMRVLPADDSSGPFDHLHDAEKNQVDNSVQKGEAENCRID